MTASAAVRRTKIDTLVTERFRAMRQHKIEGLGRVNLITGRNNTGKSSVLEDLRILASNAAPAVLYDILRSREEDVTETNELWRPLEAEGIFQVSSLFCGFPQFSTELGPGVFVSPYGGERTATLGPLWDRIALADREQDVVGALRIIDPEISAVSMVGGEGPRGTRAAIVRAAASAGQGEGASISVSNVRDTGPE